MGTRQDQRRSNVRGTGRHVAAAAARGLSWSVVQPDGCFRPDLAGIAGLSIGRVPVGIVGRWPFGELSEGVEDGRGLPLVQFAAGVAVNDYEFGLHLQWRSAPGWARWSGVVTVGWPGGFGHGSLPGARPVRTLANQWVCSWTSPLRRWDDCGVLGSHSSECSRSSLCREAGEEENHL